MLVLGAGPGGYSAAFRAADLGMKTILVERYATLGGVCLNVGCIPSKALLHLAKVMADAEDSAAHGIAFAEPEVDLDGVRGFKDGVVDKLTGGLAGLAKARQVTTVQGHGHFTSLNQLEVERPDGSRRPPAVSRPVSARRQRCPRRWPCNRVPSGIPPAPRARPARRRRPGSSLSNSLPWQPSLAPNHGRERPAPDQAQPAILQLRPQIAGSRSNRS
jgi:hypothetical protein